MHDQRPVPQRHERSAGSCAGRGRGKRAARPTGVSASAYMAEPGRTRTSATRWYACSPRYEHNYEGAAKSHRWVPSLPRRLRQAQEDNGTTLAHPLFAWPAVRGDCARVTYVAKLARRWVWLGAGEGMLRVLASQLIRRSLT